MTYQWKPGARFKTSAQEVGERLEAIRAQNDECFSARNVVDDARDVASPLHSEFEWDDPKAAELHREHQARQIIASVRVVVDDEGDAGDHPQLSIAYVSIHRSTPTGGSCYTTTARAMSDRELRAMVVEDAMSGLAAWQTRYGHLAELAEIIEAIENFRGQVA
jgi:hypothetical protein